MLSQLLGQPETGQMTAFALSGVHEPLDPPRGPLLSPPQPLSGIRLWTPASLWEGLPTVTSAHPMGPGRCACVYV